LARLAVDPNEWLELALQWERMAEQADVLVNWDAPRGRRERLPSVARG
jgi:hypothetical protein